MNVFFNLIQTFFKQNNRYLLVPWLTTAMLSVIFVNVLYLSDGIVHHAPPETYVALIFVIIVQIYYWLCVLSLYRELRLQEIVGPQTSLITSKPSTHYYQAI